MSVYSGFSTRTQETLYNRTLYQLLYLLQYRLQKFYKQGKPPCLIPPEQCKEEKFQSFLQLTYEKLFSMDHFKYLPPRFSGAAKDLILDTLGLKIDPRSKFALQFSGDIDRVRSHAVLNNSSLKVNCHSEALQTINRHKGTQSP